MDNATWIARRSALLSCTEQVRTMPIFDKDICTREMAAALFLRSEREVLVDTGKSATAEQVRAIAGSL